MEVTDPNTGMGVTVRMRRDLPGYSVTRARRSPRLRWSLPVDIQWQSECIMKFLGQNCACCDLIADPKNKPTDDDVTSRTKPPVPRAGGGGGHDTVFVDSQFKLSRQSGTTDVTPSTGLSETDKNVSQMTSSHSVITSSMTSQGEVIPGSDDVTQRLSPLALDAFPGFPLPSPSAGQRRSRRRKQLVSASDMLVAKPTQPEAEVCPTTMKLNPFDIMQSNLGIVTGDVTQEEVTTQPTLADIAEEESPGGRVETIEQS